MKILFAIIAAIEIGTIVSEDVLEPSVQNEVDHALSRADTAIAAAASNSVAVAEIPVAWTNGLTATDKAIKLISLQRADGRWTDGTNDVTKAVRSVLQSL